MKFQRKQKDKRMMMMPIKCEKLAVSRVSAPPRCFKTQKGPVKIGAIRIYHVFGISAAVRPRFTMPKTKQNH